MIEYVPSRVGGGLGSFGFGDSGGGAGLPGIWRTVTSDAGEPDVSAGRFTFDWAVFDWAVVEFDSFTLAGPSLMQPLTNPIRQNRLNKIMRLILFISL